MTKLPNKLIQALESLAVVVLVAGAEATNAGVQSHKFNWAAVGGAVLATFTKDLRLLFIQYAAGESVTVPTDQTP